MQKNMLPAEDELSLDQLAQIVTLLNVPADFGGLTREHLLNLRVAGNLQIGRTVYLAGLGTPAIAAADVLTKALEVGRETALRELSTLQHILMHPQQVASILSDRLFDSIGIN